MKSSDLSRKTAVIGIGSTRFGRLSEFTINDLGIAALKAAMQDGGVAAHEIDGVILHRIPDYQRFTELSGLNPRFFATLPGHGRFSGVCIQMAMMAIVTGQARTIALIYGNDSISAAETYGGPTSQFEDDYWFAYGMTSPGAMFALMMRQYMQKYGATEEHLGTIAKTFRDHAARNPNARYREPFEIADYHRSRMICEPLHVLDYAAICDGGLAMIMSSADRAGDFSKPPVYVAGASQASHFADASFPPADFWFRASRQAAADLYEMCGLRPSDMDGFMLYDCFSPAVVFSLEGFGICGQGEACPWIMEGHMALDGRYPTNTNGGHLSEGYMQGWGLNLEAVRQLRGECEGRRIDNARHIQYCTSSTISTSVVYGREGA
jgi:acetyl-CoA acetyltransferase